MRLLPKRSAPVPGDLHERLGIARGERLLAWGEGSGYVAATDQALHIEQPLECLGWDVIDKATWEEPLLTVTIQAHDGRPVRVLRLPIDVSGDLPAAIRDRVTASVVASEVVDIGDGVKARMVARRSGDDAPIRWNVIFEAGVDAGDPTIQARAHKALADLRSSLGI